MSEERETSENISLAEFKIWFDGFSAAYGAGNVELDLIRKKLDLVQVHDQFRGAYLAPNAKLNAIQIPPVGKT